MEHQDVMRWETPLSTWVQKSLKLMKVEYLVRGLRCLFRKSHAELQQIRRTLSVSLSGAFT